MEKALISLSGGMDSATVLARAIEAKRELVGVCFQYGSKHNQYERYAVRELHKFYRFRGLEDIIEVDLTEIGMKLRSNLLISGGEVPHGHYEEETMRQTVVPGRNIIFAAVLAGLAWSKGCSEIWMGMHAGDHFIYPDCRPQFIEYMNLAIKEGTDHATHLVVPFMNMTKAEILKTGLELMVPYEMTRTCYKNQRVACGKCGSCQERLEAFAKNCATDPLDYESRELMPKSKK